MSFSGKDGYCKQFSYRTKGRGATSKELGVGCRFLTVDSDPNAVKFYSKLGFVMSLPRVYKDKNDPNMHYDIIQGPPIG